MSLIKNMSIGFIAVGISTGVFGMNQIIETNQAINYQVKQAAITGDLSVRSDSGMYMQNFGSITTYRKADDVRIENVLVRFRDGSTASVTGTVKYRLPVSEDSRLKLHTEMSSYGNVKDVLVRSAIEGTMKQTANLFGAEEVYSTRRSEFIQLFRDQLVDGIYKTRVGKGINEVVRTDHGTPVVAKPSVLTEYGFEVVNIEINDIDFDNKTDALIASRKDAEQQETLARAEAERAKQDAITAEERGKASVAKAKYDALVVKEKAVIEAQKQTAIEMEKTLQALEEAKQIEANGVAEAARQKALVEAGLSPREQAEFDRDTAIGVAEALSKVKFPTVMSFGGGEGNSPNNPMEAVGIKFMMDIAKEQQMGRQSSSK